MDVKGGWNVHTNICIGRRSILGTRASQHGHDGQRWRQVTPVEGAILSLFSSVFGWFGVGSGVGSLQITFLFLVVVLMVVVCGGDGSRSG
jgi:hypothetical protein